MPAVPARADTSQLAKLTPSDRADIKRVQAYLNDLKTLKAQFLQVSSNGGYAEGTLYISRPGKMRIAYTPPSNVEIVANGKDLIYNDKKFQQVTYIDLKKTPASVLLQKHINLLSGGLRVTNISRGPGVLRVSVVKTADPGEGTVTLIFSDKPLTLRKWRITDAQGIITTVSLLRSHFDVPIDPKVFVFVDPEYDLYNSDDM